MLKNSSLPLIWIVLVVFDNQTTKFLKIVWGAFANVAPSPSKSGACKISANTIRPKSKCAFANTTDLAKENLPVAEIEVMIKFIKSLLVSFVT